jgi:hypothetical protein
MRSKNPAILDISGIDAQKLSVPECAYRIIEVIRPDILSRVHMQVAYNRMRESTNLVSVNPAEIRPGPKRRDKLPEKDILRLSVVHACFVEIMNDTLEEWVESFCHDFNYEREIKVWECMAACYLRCLRDRHYKVAIKKRIFGVLLGLFSGADEPELQKGFEALPSGVGKRLFAMLTDWIQEWKDKLNPLVEGELSKESDVQQIIEGTLGASLGFRVGETS